MSAKVSEITPVIVPLVEAAREIGYGRTRAYQAVKEGWFPLPVLRRGNLIYVPRASLDRYREMLESADGPIVLRDGPAS